MDLVSCVLKEEKITIIILINIWNYDCYVCKEKKTPRYVTE